MRMFGYYIVHTFINQIRKLFKTWVLIFILVCGLLGGLIGYGAGMLFDDESAGSGQYIAEVNEQGEETGRYYIEDIDEYYYCLTDSFGEILYLECETADAYADIANSADLTAQETEGLVRDDNGIAYIMVRDTKGKAYAVPYPEYYGVSENYDAVLDYEKEAELYYGEIDSEETEEPVIDEIPEDAPSWFFGENGVYFAKGDGEYTCFGKVQFAEAIAMLISIVTLFFFAFRADQSGGKIFLMADVNLLFSSDRKPQSILLFRLLTKLGSILILMLFYSAIYMRSLMSAFNITGFGVCMLFVTIFFLFGFGMLMQVLIYTLCATKPQHSKLIKGCIYGVIALLLGIYAWYWKQTNMNFVGAAVELLSAQAMRFFPIAGWLKGEVGNIMAGDMAGMAAWLAVMTAGLGVIGSLIWGIKADFYEDAMSKSEEVARLMQQMQEKGTIFSRKKKNNEEGGKAKPSRAERGADGINHGQGASTLFWKAMHIRYRFAFLHYFTKTTDTYLITAVFVSAFAKLVLKEDMFLPGIMMLGSMVFFRSMSNPLEEDINSDVFRMFPDSTAAKVFWSLMGGVVNCILDLLPALVLLTAVFMKNPLVTLAWFGLMITVYVYATTVGAFINVSIPITAGATIKQIVQIMFIYFGLIPDAGLIAFGVFKGCLPLMAVIAAVFNLALSFVFLLLTGDMLEPKEGSMAITTDSTGAMKQIYSGIGWALILLFVSGSVAQVAALIGALAADQIKEGSVLVQYAVTFLPLYLVGFPAGIWMIGRLPKPGKKTEKEDFSVLRVLKCLLIGAGLAYGTNFIASGLIELVHSLFGGTTSGTEVLTNMITKDSILLQAFFFCICAPVFEEIVFRKLIIDRTSAYGEKRAVIFSAVLFGLFHGNLAQFMYATVLGLVLGYVYVRTGKLRHVILMHMLFNMQGSLLAGTIQRMEEAGTHVLLTNIYNYAIIGLIVLSIPLLLANLRKIHFNKPEKKADFRMMWINSGIVCFILMMTIMIGYTLVAA